MDKSDLIEKAFNDYVDENDILSQFINDYCQIGNNLTVSSSDFLNTLIRKKEIKILQKDLLGLMAKKGFRYDKQNTRIYIGIDLIKDELES